MTGGQTDGINYERLFDKTCDLDAVGTYSDLIFAFKACERNNQCNFILDKYCDGKSRFSLCRTVKESRSGSCVYKKRKLLS